MSQRSAFFDAQNGDRSYASADFARLFSSLTGRDGVIAGDGDELLVSPTSPESMAVQIGLGSAWIQGRHYNLYQTPEVLELEAADNTHPRIDRIVVRLDLTNAARTITVAVKTGTPGADPEPPALTRDTETWELSLAQVRVEAQATEIEAEDITDERGDETLCGFVMSPADLESEIEDLQGDVGDLRTAIGQSLVELGGKGIATDGSYAFHPYQGSFDSLRPTAPTTPAMAVDVAAGLFYDSNGERIEVPATKVTINPAHSTNPRIDLIYVSSATRLVSYVAGTPAPNPVPPSVPAGGFKISEVRVPAGATSIQPANVFDCRDFVRIPQMTAMRVMIDSLSAALHGPENKFPGRLEFTKDGKLGWHMGLDHANGDFDDFVLAAKWNGPSTLTDIIYLREDPATGDVAVGFYYTPPETAGENAARVQITGRDGSSWHNLMLRHASGQTGDLIRFMSSGGTKIGGFDALGRLDYSAAGNLSTTATAGDKTLPSNPDGFLIISVNSVEKKIPYYNA